MYTGDYLNEDDLDEDLLTKEIECCEDEGEMSYLLYMDFNSSLGTKEVDHKSAFEKS